MKSLSTEYIRNFNFNKLFNLLGVFNFCLLLAISASLLFSSPQPSEAKTTSAQAGSSVYYANISNEDTVTIPVVPTSSQAEYTATNEITFSSTCTAGSYIYINTNSNTDNALTRTGSDTGKKTIDAVAGDVTTGLTDNTWGYKVSGNAFTQVPVNTSPAVLYSSTKAETNTPVEVTYGVKVDNTIPSGTYTNDVVYTVVVDNRCLQYTLKFDTQGGSAISDQSVNYGDTVNLSSLTTTRSGYIFGGWSNGSLDFTGSETAAQPNPSNDFTVTLSACWVKQDAYTYDYTGGEQTFTTPCNGYYKLEVWGAQGGSAGYSGYGSNHGGYGAYSIGVTRQEKNTNLYINVGGSGNDAFEVYSYTIKGNSYNGGGNASSQYYSSGLSPSWGKWFGAGGGGATHVALISGVLSSLESQKGTLIDGSYYNSSKILIVASGGGGAAYSLDTSRRADGGNGGGVEGNDGNGTPAHGSSTDIGKGGSQTSGGYSSTSGPVDAQIMQAADFGLGCKPKSDHSYDSAGYMKVAGGSGWYGGGCGTHNGAAGGSSYIASSHLISGGGVTKHMSGYSISTSSATETLTYSNTTTPSATATADIAKLNNGYAKITYLGVSI